MFGTRVALVAAVAVAAIPLALARAAPSAHPGRFRGEPLAEKPGLRLAISHATPFVLDLDSEGVTPIPGVPKTNGGSVLGVGSGAAVVITQQGQLYGVRNGTAPVSPLGA